MKRILLTAILSSAFTLGLVQLFAAKDGITRKVVLENDRVVVVDRTFPVGVSREPHIRETDQVIVFVDDCIYDRVDAGTGKVDRKTRKAGEVLWHAKGEHAPGLVNRGTKPFRSLMIALK